MFDPLLRWALYGAIRWVPPRGRGMRIVSIIDRYRPPTPRQYSVRLFGARIGCDLRDPVQRAIFYSGTYEPQLTTLLRKELRIGDTFLDVGANVGYFSFLAAAMVGASGNVLAFEPAPDHYRRLCSSAAQAARHACGHYAVVEVHPVALSDEAGDAVLSATAENSSGERFLSNHGVGDLVRTVPLVEHLPDLRPNIVKIDVEGAELRVLRGMEAILRSSRPRLVLAEAIDGNLRRFGDCPRDIVEFMSSLDYSNELLAPKYSAPMLVFRPAMAGPAPPPMSKAMSRDGGVGMTP